MAHAESIAQNKLAEQRAQEGMGDLGLETKHKGDAPAFSVHESATLSSQQQIEELHVCPHGMGRTLVLLNEDL